MAREQYLAQGVPVKISIAPGTYRPESTLELGDIPGDGKDALLILEGKEPGKVFIRGSITQGFEADTWNVVDRERKIYRHDWPYNFQPFSELIGWYNCPANLSRRRELLFVNGQLLIQRNFEEFKWFGLHGQVKGDLVATGKKANHGQYKGVIDYTTLEPGEFGVFEIGPEDDTRLNIGSRRQPVYTKPYSEFFREFPHPNPDSIFIRLPDSMDSLEGAEIEIGVRESLITADNKNNIVLRNLTLQHCVGRDRTGVIESYQFGHPKKTRGRNAIVKQNWLIENCDVTWNNQNALRLAWISGFTIRNCRLDHNSGVGANLSFVRNLLVQDSSVSYNGWRNQISQYTPHSVGGLDLSAAVCVFSNTQFSGNYGTGCRVDHTGSSILCENCEFSESLRGSGAFLEITTGPWMFRECRFEKNASSGLLVNTSQNIAMERCRFAQNTASQIEFRLSQRETRLSSGLWDKIVPLDYPYVKNVNIVDSRLFGKPGVPLIMVGTSAAIAKDRTANVRADFLKHELTLSRNEYSSGLDGTPVIFNDNLMSNMQED